MKNLDSCSVYKITCKINSKSYIGWTTQQDVARRWGKGKSNYLRKNKYGNYRHPRLAEDILKYGWENFDKEILYTGLTYEDALSKEKEMIEKYDSFNNGYNSTRGGERRFYLGCNKINNKKAVSNCKSKLVYCYNKNGDLICSIKGISKMAEYLNVPYDCISDCCYKVKDQHNSHKTAYGYVFTTVELTKEEVIKRFQSYKRNFDYIYLYDINGNFLDKFDSYEKAIEKTGICRPSISGCCNGKTRFVNTYVFSFKELTKEEIIKRQKRYKQLNYTLYLIDKEGNKLKSYKSYKEAANDLNIPISSIVQNANGCNKTTYGYRFIKESDDR